jgi:hypothetical protein
MRCAIVLVLASDESVVAARYSFTQEIRDKTAWSLVSCLLSPSLQEALHVTCQ